MRGAGGTWLLRKEKQPKPVANFNPLFIVKQFKVLTHPSAVELSVCPSTEIMDTKVTPT